MIPIKLGYKYLCRNGYIARIVEVGNARVYGSLWDGDSKVSPYMAWTPAGDNLINGMYDIIAEG